MKIFSHIMEILKIFYSNKPVFITFLLMLVNKYLSLPTFLESAKEKPYSENVHYLKSSRKMGCNHKTSVKSIIMKCLLISICWYASNIHKL